MNSIIESLYFWKKLMNECHDPKDFWFQFNKYQLYLGLGRTRSTMIEYLEDSSNG